MTIVECVKPFISSACSEFIIRDIHMCLCGLVLFCPTTLVSVIDSNVGQWTACYDGHVFFLRNLFLICHAKHHAMQNRLLKK